MKLDAISLRLTTEGRPFLPLLKEGGLLLSRRGQHGSRLGQGRGMAVL